MNLVQSYLTKNPCYTANVNKADSRYTTFQQRGPLGLMLHSVGCAQPSAQVFISNWNNENYTNACVHGFIDANSGTVYQCLPWNFRGWHGGGSSNNTHVGVEMCESGAIRYMLPSESGYQPGKFIVQDANRAKADCTRAYNAAVELYASICQQYHLDPLTAICSHKEGYAMGIASCHGDPEHYWSQLGMPYTMDGFRAAVKAKMEEGNMTEQEIKNLISLEVARQAEALKTTLESKFAQISTALSGAYGQALTDALASMSDSVDARITDRIGKQIGHLSDIPGKATRAEFKPLLDDEYINGGTPKEVDDTDIRLPWSVARALLVAKRYTDSKLAEFLMEDAEAYDGTDAESIPLEDPYYIPGSGEE